jgi:hypothetical protein
MKKTVLFSMVLVLLGAMGVTGLAWAQVLLPKGTLPPTKIVFISSRTYAGNLGGLAGADAKCQELARAAGLSGTYKAWLSDGKGANPITRFTHNPGPYKLRNGLKVANSWNELITTGKILQPINIMEQGYKMTIPYYVWTGFVPSGGINPDGSIIWVTTSSMLGTAHSCNGWTTGVSLNISDAYTFPTWGYCGYSYPTDSPIAIPRNPYHWTYAAQKDCDATLYSQPKPIYCFEQ